MKKIIYLILVLCLVSACAPKKEGRRVVIYTSQDQVFSEPVLKDFEKKSGIKVLAVFDIEAAKGVGLANRLIAEKERPQADVFWNGEFGQTIRLKEKGVFAPYVSPNAADIPGQYRDRENCWTGFGARTRVILVNTKELAAQDYPKSVFDLLDPKYPANRIAFAYPLFGTTLTQAAAMYAELGPEKAADFYRKLKKRGIRTVDGNAVVRDLVVSGQLIMGLTDSDDSCGAIRGGASVKVIFPDQDGIGTLFVPNTVGLVAGAPHPKEAKELIDYLLSSEVEEKLIDSGAIQMSLREGKSLSSNCVPIKDIRGMKVSYPDILHNIERASSELREIFVR
ncbi:MAG: extracellular solute-binding protein [Candidatus Omnitrophica bacterium]|nr:extracellular solute-binding protein [Candidatus Omnitrophota bacterium]